MGDTQEAPEKKVYEEFEESLSMKDYFKAKSILAKMEGVERDFAHVRYLLDIGRMRQGEELLDKLLTEHPDSDEVLRLRGELFCRTCSFAQAYDQLEKYLERQPDHLQSLYSMIRCCIGLKNYKQGAYYADKAVELCPYNGQMRAVAFSALCYRRDELVRILQEQPDNDEDRSNLSYVYWLLEMYDEAYEQVAELEQKGNQTEESIWVYGRILVRNEEYYKAYEYLKKSIAINPKNILLRKLMALSLYSNGKANEALEIYQGVLKDEPKDAAAMWHMAKIFNMQERYEEALRTLGRAIKLKPHWAMESMQAEAFLGLGKYEEALEAIQRVIEVYGAPKHYECKMKIYLDMQNYRKVFDLYNDMMDMDMETAKMTFYKAKALELAEQTKDALKYIDRAIELEREAGIWHLEKANMLAAAKQYDDALEEVNMAIEMEPNLSKAYVCKAKIYCNMEQHQQCIQVTDDAIQKGIMDRKGFLYFYKARSIYELERNLDKAVACLQQAIDLFPDSGDYYYEMGFYYSDSEIFDTAMEYFVKTIKVNPDSLNAYYSLSRCLYKLARYKECVDTCRSGLKLNPKNKMMLTIYAQGLFAFGDYQGALDAAGKILNQDPNHMDTLLVQLKSYFKLKQYIEAMRVWEYMCLTDPESELITSNAPFGKKLEKLCHKSGKKV